jgi:hypothetical protein
VPHGIGNGYVSLFGLGEMSRDRREARSKSRRFEAGRSLRRPRTAEGCCEYPRWDFLAVAQNTLNRYNLEKRKPKPAT